MRRNRKCDARGRAGPQGEAALWHPYTKHSSLRGAPLPVMVRGRGPYLFDSAGRRYLDAISSWWCCNLGHGHPRLVRAIRRQASRLQHSIIGGLSHPGAAKLASRLSALMPAGGSWRVMFASDGASAVEAALKIAVQYRYNTGERRRDRFVSLRNAYHGDTLGAVSVGRVELFHRPFRSVLFPVYRAEAPYCAGCVHGKDPATCGQECFESMERILRRHARRITAVIVEPLCQGAAGMRIYPPAYLRKLATVCARHGILLIADEIATGMGRTGRMFAFEHAGIRPDIVCVGKGLSGGTLPLSATLVKKAIWDKFADRPGRDGTFYHGHTFAGNPIACAAALETLAVYEGEDILERARAGGRALARALRGLEGLPGVSAVRSIGMIGAFDFTAAEALRRELLVRHRILVRPLGNTVYLMLPLNSDVNLIADTVVKVGEAIRRAGSAA